MKLNFFEETLQLLFLILWCCIIKQRLFNFKNIFTPGIFNLNDRGKKKGHFTFKITFIYISVHYKMVNVPFKSNRTQHNSRTNKKKKNHNKSTGNNLESKDTDVSEDLCIVTMKPD